MTENKALLFPEIITFIKEIDVDSISNERKSILQPLINFIQQKNNNKQEARLHFICTHNSRRSHLSQIWAQTMAAYFSVNNVVCYSGGTEGTALFPEVIKTLQKVGFQIEKISATNNPIYSIKYEINAHPIIGFSKKIEASFNPKSQFAAVMTCNAANESCPIIAGAETRIPITYEDPKVFDNTPQQLKKYAERSLQIATEMYYVFSKINS